MARKTERAGDFGHENKAVSQIDGAQQGQREQYHPGVGRKQKNIREKIEVHAYPHGRIGNAQDFSAWCLQNGKTAILIEPAHFRDPENMR